MKSKKIVNFLKKRVVIVSLIFLLPLTVFVVYKMFSGGNQDAYTKVKVERGDVVEVVSVAGTVIPAKQIDLQFETIGKILSVLVEVGDKAKKGDVLVRLASGELNAQLQSYQAALEMAQAKLAKEQSGTRPEDVKVYETAVENAQVTVSGKEQALANAEADAENNLENAYEDGLDETNTGYTKTDKALLVFSQMRQSYFNSTSQLDYKVQSKETDIDTALDAAKTALNRAIISESFEDIDEALSKIKTAVITSRDGLAYLRAAMDDPSKEQTVTSASETTVDTERTTIDTELASLTSAQQTISSTKTANQTSVNNAQSALDSAEAALKTAEDELALKKAGARQEDIDLLRAEVRQAQANVRQIQEKIGKMTLIAPVDGIITSVANEEGETVQANAIVVSMINAGNFQLEANVSETEIAKVKLGNKVVITLDALGPNEEFPGEIVQIDPAETVISGVTYYKITSVFNAEDERIKSGMTVNLDVETDKKENVVYLPYYAIKEKDGQKYILLSDGKSSDGAEKEIKTGLEGETRVEIIEGLDENNWVLVEK